MKYEVINRFTETPTTSRDLANNYFNGPSVQIHICTLQIVTYAYTVCVLRVVAYSTASALVLFRFGETDVPEQFRSFVHQGGNRRHSDHIEAVRPQRATVGYCNRCVSVCCGGVGGGDFCWVVIGQHEGRITGDWLSVFRRFRDCVSVASG